VSLLPLTPLLPDLSQKEKGEEGEKKEGRGGSDAPFLCVSPPLLRGRRKKRGRGKEGGMVEKRRLGR